MLTPHQTESQHHSASPESKTQSKQLGRLASTDNWDDWLQQTGLMSESFSQSKQLGHLAITNRFNYQTILI